MGTDVHVVLVGAPFELLEVARELIEDLEARWSRFRPTSEVSLMNLMAGEPVRVSPPTIDLVGLAVEGARLTGGRFDPTVLGDVVRAGYDRSFELLRGRTGDGQSSLRRGYADIAIDAGGSTVTMPPGVGFDPGGIGKGYAADLVVEALLEQGAAGVCANIGGDLRVGGIPPGPSWSVAVAHPLARRPVAVVGLRDGAVATSMRTHRTWGPRHEARHHLIDPDTGHPARSGLASATAVAAAGWQAEVVSKAAFVSGLQGGLVVFDSTGTEGLLVDDTGGVHRSSGFGAFTASSGAPATTGGRPR